MLEAPTPKASIHSHRTMFNLSPGKDSAGGRAHVKPAGRFASASSIREARPNGMKSRNPQGHPANDLSSGKNPEVATPGPFRLNPQRFWCDEAKPVARVRRTPRTCSLPQFRFEIEG